MQNDRHEQNAHSKLRDLHITGKHPSSENGAMQANTLMMLYRKGKHQRASQCSRHVYWLDLLPRQQQNVKCIQAFTIIELPYRIANAIFLIYRIVYRSNTVFDIS